MSKSEDTLYTFNIKKVHMKWAGIIAIALIVLGIFSWVAVSEQNIHAQQDSTISKLKSQLSECQAEATAWYNATTSLSDQIAFAALKGLPAEKVDTNISTAFAVKGHELNCIQPKLPTG